jgi:hypothetical protein
MRAFPNVVGTRPETNTRSPAATAAVLGCGAVAYVKSSSVILDSFWLLLRCLDVMGGSESPEDVIDERGKAIMFGERCWQIAEIHVYAVVPPHGHAEGAGSWDVVSRARDEQHPLGGYP